MGDRCVVKNGVRLFLLSVCFILISAEDTKSCNDIQSNIDSYNYNGYYLWNVWSSSEHLTWYNVTFWGGHVQIPFKDTVDFNDCFASWSSGLVVLLEKHPNTDTVDEKVVTLKACSLSSDGLCQWNMDVLMRKCNDDLLYAFPWYDSSNPDTWNQYICFDRIYSETCSETSTLYSFEIVEEDFIRFNEGDVGYGWFNGFRNGKQYVFPSTEDLDTVFEKCLLSDWGYFLQDSFGTAVGETPVRISFCKIWKYNNVDYYDYSDDNGNCFNYIYVRSCNGKLQYDLSGLLYWWHPSLCFIHKNNIFVQPDIRHEIKDVVIDDQQKTEYVPFLQYKCLFEMEEGIAYKTNWYINGTLEQETGPSSEPQDLMFNKEYLNDLPPGYEVQCGVIEVSEIESNESLSGIFFAGLKVPDKSISLTKNGAALVDMELTTPIGCRYTGSDTSHCYEELVLEDPYYNPEVCAGGIRVQDTKDATKSSFIVQTVSKGEKWSSKTYTVKLSTDDKDYEDPIEFDLEMSLTDSSGNANKRAVRKKGGWVRMIVGVLHVDVTNNDLHKNKRCYSHVDPHHRTSDGVHFEMQKPGDHMMYLNSAYQSEIRTPIGTVVDISLHTWSNTMNIDIYMSAKDFGNVGGLCGNFDGDRSNDFLHRDGETISSDRNVNYMFSDSWILTKEENLFTNKDRVLEPWKVFNAKDSDPACTPTNSITRKKCDVPRRNKRSLSKRSVLERKEPQYFKLAELRVKRSAQNITEGEAWVICNASINNAPAVLELPDMLAGEDLNEVAQQCVYDLTVGQDISWVDAHITALNDAAQTILKMNPTYVANNSELVKSFLSKTCSNNCSQNGICTEEGLCECNSTYGGPDCSIDIRIPPLVYEIQGGDVCDTSNGDDCSCFQLRTNNFFEGFMCKMSKYKVYFNGTKVTEISNTFEGDYIDIFTGVCCDSFFRRKLSVDDISFDVILYEFSASNDGFNYGEPNSVYVYDTTCIEHGEVDDTIIFKIKDDFCFIDGVCVADNRKKITAGECFLCDPTLDQYNWIKENCKEIETGLKTATIVGVAVGSFVAVFVVAVLIYFLCLKTTKKNRSVQDSHTDLRTTFANEYLPQSVKSCEDFKEDKTANVSADNEPNWSLFLPDIVSTDAAKPVCKRSIWSSKQHAFPDTEVEEDMDKNEDTRKHEEDDVSVSDDDTLSEHGTMNNVTTISVRSLEIF